MSTPIWVNSGFTFLLIYGHGQAVRRQSATLPETAISEATSCRELHLMPQNIQTNSDPDLRSITAAQDRENGSQPRSRNLKIVFGPDDVSKLLARLKKLDRGRVANSKSSRLAPDQGRTCRCSFHPE
jgi:hypothetical protein